MQEITCFLSQPQDPLANLKWQLHARAAWITPDLNSEAIVHDLSHQYSVEACLLDQVSGEISSRTCYFEKSWCWFSAMKITIYIKYLGCFFFSLVPKILHVHVFERWKHTGNQHQNHWLFTVFKIGLFTL